jgi:hypothetical protein
VTGSDCRHTELQRCALPACAFIEHYNRLYKYTPTHGHFMPGGWQQGKEKNIQSLLGAKNPFLFLTI